MKLPVFRAIGATFAYFVSAFGVLLRIMWLPVLLMSVGMAFASHSYFQSMTALMDLGSDPDPQAAMALMGEMWGPMGLMFLLSVVFYPMIFTGVMRHVIRGEAPRGPFYLSFGADEIRILITFILVVLLVMVAYAVGFVALMALTALGGVAAAAAGPIGETAAGLIIFGGVIGFICALIWFSLRLSLALPAAIGARAIGVPHSWAAAKGNVWRLLAYWLVWWAIFVVLQLFLLSVVFSDFFSQMAQIIAAAGDPAAIEALHLELFREQASAYEIGSPRFLITFAAGLVYSFVTFAFWAVSSAVAWRYIADGERA